MTLRNKLEDRDFERIVDKACKGDKWARLYLFQNGYGSEDRSLSPVGEW